MATERKPTRRELQGPGRRQIVADFDGGTITSDGGALLLSQVDRHLGLCRRLADAFVDARDPERIEHSVEELIRQRVFALASGYEDLNDHDLLRKDPALAAFVGKTDPTGQDRVRQQDHGAPLASRSTLNRLDHALDAQGGEDRYHRIVADPEAVESFLVDVFLDSFEEVPERIVLDFDATDNPIHGEQEGRFFHGYYGCYCYLPLYVFCGRHILCAKLRPSNIDASAGSLEVLEALVDQIRQRWSEVEILVRADSGFARDRLMAWCEANEVDYVLGLARNSRLQALLDPTFAELEAVLEENADAARRRFADLRYQTCNSWSRERRVIGKAEITRDSRNPRFVVTTLDVEEHDAQHVYEQIYCARGEMENRIKEQQLDLFSTRTSGHWMRVNQVRLWFSAVAYMLFEQLRRLALAGTDLERARCSTIRSKLIKIGTRVRVTVRRIWLSMSSAYPYQDLFWQVLGRLDRLGPPRYG